MILCFAAKDKFLFSRTRSRAASYFARDGKVTKTPPGFAQDGHFVSIFAHPGPHYGGRQLGSLAVIAKARVVQLIGFCFYDRYR